MTQTLSVTEMARHFAEYIDRVAYHRESFVLVRGHKPMAEVRPLPKGKRLAEFPALLASLPRLSSTEATQLHDDLTEIRKTLTSAEAHDYGRETKTD